MSQQRHQVRIQPQRRTEVDLRKLARALIELALEENKKATQTKSRPSRRRSG